MLLLLNPGAGTGTADAYIEPVSEYGFTQAKEVVVRIQALDGAWEVCGADTARGIVPEKVQLTSDQWGSKTATFDLRRDPKAAWPDIGAFAPVEIEVGGRPVWSGRVAETPVRDSTDSVISVQCEGWQAHLDDDLYERIYVHSNLNDYKDARSFPEAVLGRSGTAAAQVNVDDGALVLSFPRGTDFVASVQAYACAVLDMGPNSLAKRIVFDVMAPSRTGSGGYWGFHCRFSDLPRIDATAINDVYTNDITALSTTTPTTIAATSATARRYVMFFVYHSSGSTFTSSEDNTVRIGNAQVFADTAYESGNASVLKADVVVKDALDRATLMLDSDRTQISAGTFNIPELAPAEPRTPRQMWEAVNAFEDYQAKIDVLKRPVFKAKPSSPDVEVGQWSGMEFEDSSASSGEDIYSRLIVTGSQPNSQPLRVYRTQAQVGSTGAPTSQKISGDLGIASRTPTNDSFTSNTFGWTATNGSTITRDTSTFDSTPASGRWDATGASDALPANAKLTGTIDGSFQAGVTYRMVFMLRVGTLTGISAGIQAEFGTSTDYGQHTIYMTGATAGFSRVTFDWTPLRTVSSGVQLRLTSKGSLLFGTASTYVWIDSLTIERATTTLVERRGFLRTKVLSTTFMLTEGAAQQIADKWLLGHRSTSFKGRAKLTGNNAIRQITTGRPVPVEEMLLRTGELVRFSDRIDPDSGAAGRDGRVVEVQYSADTDSVDLTIDNSRAGFEALLERLGVVLGQNRS